MKIWAVFAVSIGATLLIASGMVVILVQDLAFGIGTFVAALLYAAAVLVPTLTFSFLGWWDVRRSSDGRPRYRNLVVLNVATQTIGAIGLTGWAALTGASWVVPVALVIVGTLCTVVAFTAGPALQRRNTARPSPRSGTAGATDLPAARTDSAALAMNATQPSAIAPHDSDPAYSMAYPRAAVRRDIRRSIVTFVIVLVVVTSLCLWLVSALDIGLWALAFVFGLALALIAMQIAVVVATFGISRLVRELIGGDLARARALNRVVVRGKPDALSPEDEQIAAPWARLAWLLQAYSLANMVTLFIALALIQAPNLAGSFSFLALGLIILLALTLAVFVPFALVQLRRTRRYAIDHADGPGARASEHDGTADTPANDSPG